MPTPTPPDPRPGPETPELLITPVEQASPGGRTLVLAHGAGQGADSPFMETMAVLLAARGLRVVRFDFPYMARARAEGRRRPPDPRARLLACWGAVLDALERAGEDPARLIIGGKSMGGRMASLAALERPVAGLLCLGYPFHPPGKPGSTRIEHLEDIATPTLICQGERDPFGRPDEVACYRLGPAVELVWIADGEHSFKPTRGSGLRWEDTLTQAADAAAAWAHGLDG